MLCARAQGGDQIPADAINRAIDIATKHDRGSTLSYLASFDGFSEVFSAEAQGSSKFRSILHTACKMKAKHCVRFLLSHDQVKPALLTKAQVEGLEEELTPLQITMKNFREDKDGDICILYELINAEKKLIESTGMDHAIFENLESTQVQEIHIENGKVKKQVRALLRDRERFLESLALDVRATNVNDQKYVPKRGCLPRKTHACYKYLFYTIFWIIYLTNIFIIDAKLDEWCFGCATTLISLKLFLTFC